MTTKKQITKHHSGDIIVNWKKLKFYTRIGYDREKGLSNILIGVDGIGEKYLHLIWMKAKNPAKNLKRINEGLNNIWNKRNNAEK